jgi:hypothetical protein
MGSLTPGVTLIYESPDGGETIFAREEGSSKRVMVGQSLKAMYLMNELEEDTLWGNIRRASKSNITLQKALEQCIMIYHLSTQHASYVPPHHPV